jgi:hypothetical protein
VELIVELFVITGCWLAIAAEAAHGVSVTVTVCAGPETVTVTIPDPRRAVAPGSFAVTAVSKNEMNSDAA